MEDKVILSQSKIKINSETEKLAIICQGPIFLKTVNLSVLPFTRSYSTRTQLFNTITKGYKKICRFFVIMNKHQLFDL